MALPTSDLAHLLKDLESDRVERKESAQNADRIGQIICAFANDLAGHGLPGVLFVGIADDGRPSGLPITDQLLQQLAAFRDQGNILPPPSINVRKVELADAVIAVVEVQPSAAPPIRYKGQIWVRVGPRRAIANADDERKLTERRRSLDLPYDSRPVAGASQTDLDLRLFEELILPSLVPSDVLAANGRTIEQRLASLRLTSPDGVPTAAGLLALGVDTLAWLPGAYVQFLRINGPDLTAPINDEKRISGTLVTVLRQLDEILALNINSSVDFTSGVTESRVQDYPIAALQQIARNAIMHRSYESSNSPVRITWYDDRVEFISPGALFGVVASGGLESGLTDYRNPALAEMMRGLGYVQRFGAGIPVVRRTLADNGNPKPLFEAASAHVAVTLWRRS